MWRRALLRAFSNDPQVSSKLSSEYVKAANARPVSRTRTFQEGFEDMKEKFGPDYQTPFDKYDLHVPKVEVQEDNRSSFQRYHERHEFSQCKVKAAKTLLAIVSLGFLGMGLLAIRKRNMDRQREASTKAALKEFNEAQAQLTANHEAIVQIRREQIAELKRKHKQL
jgi:hypothetical protein